MATITSVNNTTPGATYDIHDTTTWIGGVVPGPDDTVVFQSATATTWFLTQSWTIQGITWSASTNRSESGIEVPSTVSQNIIFTQTVTSWAGANTPMTNNSGAVRSKPWLRVDNPAGTTFTLNLPGSLYLSLQGYSTVVTSLITCDQAGTAILNIAGDIRGHELSDSGAGALRKNAIYINGSSGYTEINCVNLRGGGNPSNDAVEFQAYLSNAIRIEGQLAGSSVEINFSNMLEWIMNTTNGWDLHNAGAISITGPAHNGITLNATGYISYAQNARYGNIWDNHTSGTLTINATEMNNGLELWTQGWNANYTQTLNSRRNYYGSGNSADAITIFDCDIYGPNNIYNSTTSLNHSIITTGAATHYVYGNIYSSTLNRYQTPFYYDNDNVLFYHMTGTAYVSINPIVWSTRVQFLAFTGGFYHANVVQANDPTNLYSPNRCPFIVPTLTPNPNYTGGNQLTWTYIKGAANRAETTTMINANYTGYSPAESNVRLGVVYGNGLRTGTCAVPLPSQVALGIGVDNTVGTWAGDINIIDQSSFADAVWNYDLTQVTNTTNGTGQRLLNNATIESTGDQIAALGV